MVPSRHQLPTPAWAELPPAGSTNDAFRAFIDGERWDHRSRSGSERHIDSAVRMQADLDDEAPQLGLL